MAKDLSHIIRSFFEEESRDKRNVRYGPFSLRFEGAVCKKDGKVFYWGKTTNSFSYVRTSTGQVGYMYKGFLKAYGAANRNQVYYCKVKSAQLYKRSGKSLKKAGKLTKYQHVIVYEVRGSWAYIKTLIQTATFGNRPPDGSLFHAGEEKN